MASLIFLVLVFSPYGALLSLAFQLISCPVRASDDTDYDIGEAFENVPNPPSDAGNYGEVTSSQQNSS
ncbi:unnamed protein product [Protopolystoma xenopodis]|uniref:Uncharacterized protein n=1 Tax=Protopolystoma xenopodis TaxID=117903 RepID=A0A448WWC9_9PLAT|nr:unnamed protein product [Protopolystoma xenopodis]